MMKKIRTFLTSYTLEVLTLDGKRFEIEHSFIGDGSSADAYCNSLFKNNELASKNLTIGTKDIKNLKVKNYIRKEI